MPRTELIAAALAEGMHPEDILFLVLLARAHKEPPAKEPPPPWAKGRSLPRKVA